MKTTEISLLGERISTTVATYATLKITDLKGSLQDSSSAAKFTPLQANKFVNQYELIHQQPNVDSALLCSLIKSIKNTSLPCVALRTHRRF
jgi:hypothetical protein